MDTNNYEELITTLINFFSTPEEEFSVASIMLSTEFDKIFDSPEFIKISCNFINEQLKAGKTIEEIETVIDDSQSIIGEIFEPLSLYADTETKENFLNHLIEKSKIACKNMLSTYLENNPLIQITKLHENATIPTYAHYTDAGCDIYCPEETVIAPHTYSNKIKTGIAVAIPEGWQLAIRPRSGLSAKTTLRLSNCVGTIDSGYRDEICVLMDNIGDEPVVIHSGDRIAQFIPEKVWHATFNLVKDVKAIGENRGGGFGSSGN